MKPILKTALIGLLATAFIVPATSYAFQDKGQDRQDRFAKVDTNGDGGVDLTEFMTQATKRGEARGKGRGKGQGKGIRGGRGMRGGMAGHNKPADLNGDGSISLDEFSKPTLDALEQKTSKRLKSRFEDLDRNEDGKLSKGEQERPMRKRFERMDKNEDGKLSMKELGQSRRGMHKKVTSGGKGDKRHKKKVRK